MLFAFSAALALPRPIIRPLFSLDIGIVRNDYSAEKEAVYGYYHDLEKDEMLYDMNLLCNQMEFSGFGPNVNGRAGAVLFRQIAPFLEFGYYRLKGEYGLKDYSRDKNRTKIEGTWSRNSFGFGILYFPYVNPESFFDGTFIGPSFGWITLKEEYDQIQKKHDYHYDNNRFFIKVEMGKLWEVTEHYFIGFTIKEALEMGMSESTELGNYIGLYLTIQRH
ncbi:MAG: hypothetical protein HUK21_04325 [Fibrobacteraceae bacterium]|nr:hypothetical protein [Fibrobacteraceae bacterium]